MPKSKQIYICQKCGAEFLRWSGKCEQCGEWNTLVQEKREEERSGIRFKAEGEIKKPLNLVQVKSQDFRRLVVGISEFDRVLGGGLVPGSCVLIGGDPGIGKSTLVLQICHQVGEQLSAKSQGDKNSISKSQPDKAETEILKPQLDETEMEISKPQPAQSFASDFQNNEKGFSPSPAVLYISGEESAEQIKMRAERLNLNLDRFQFLAETNIDNIIATCQSLKPRLVICDSIQCMWSEDVPSSAGSINSLRDATAKLVNLAKKNQITVIIIGHVTKEGAVAGPKTLEHLVDTVLYLEGDQYHFYRILRAVKNRFGSTQEAGIFEMKPQGLVEVKDPSGVFLEERKLDIPGSCVTATIEGSRAFLLEIQGLVSRTTLAYPRRTASGYDYNRLQLLCAVLAKRAGLRLDDQDVYLNVAGGFKVNEPAVDLACCLALASAYHGKIIPREVCAFGEVGLSGEIRSPGQIGRRISEAEKLGFSKIVMPKTRQEIKTKKEIIYTSTVSEAIEKLKSL